MKCSWCKITFICMSTTVWLKINVTFIHSVHTCRTVVGFCALPPSGFGHITFLWIRIYKLILSNGMYGVDVGNKVATDKK